MVVALVLVNAFFVAAGILHLQDLFRHLRQPQAGRDLCQLVRPALCIPETMPLDELLHTFQHRQTHIALVVDEHGSIAGFVTLEDVVEEVFGEVHDALEAAQLSIQPLPDGRILMRGDMRLRELQDRFGWEFRDDDGETMAGSVMKISAAPPGSATRLTPPMAPSGSSIWHGCG